MPRSLFLCYAREVSPRLPPCLVLLATSALLSACGGGAEDCPTVCREIGGLAGRTASVADALCDGRGADIAEEEDEDTCRRRSADLFQVER
ncbi:MAG: hypothetical protein AAF627_12640 [Myxococcota bacterium]